MLFRFDEFDRAFRLLDELQRRSEVSRAPALTETEDELTLRLDVPGVRPEDVEINIEDGALTLTARREVTPPEGYTAHLAERRSLAVRRSFVLPRQVDPERISATLTDGVLTLAMAKAQVPAPRQITVTAG